VVASAVGGLLTIVEHGRTGFLVPDRDPSVFAAHTSRILADATVADAMSRAAAAKARGYTWAFAAARLRRVYADLAARDRVVCR
jgi:glycosyltransferase involved in cell wall biosynthesis